MFKNILVNFDKYLLILILLNSYIMIFSDTRHYDTEKEMMAKRESITIGVIILVVVVCGYVANRIWI